MSPFTQIQNRQERCFLMQTLHEELVAQKWSQAELIAFYNSPLPDLIVQITASTLRNVDALTLPVLSTQTLSAHSFSGVLDEQGTL